MVQSTTRLSTDPSPSQIRSRADQIIQPVVGARARQAPSRWRDRARATIRREPDSVAGLGSEHDVGDDGDENGAQVPVFNRRALEPL